MFQTKDIFVTKIMLKPRLKIPMVFGYLDQKLHACKVVVTCVVIYSLVKSYRTMLNTFIIYKVMKYRELLMK